MTSPTCKVPATALISPKTTPPARLTTVQTTPPTSPSNPPPVVQVCCCDGAVLYCTITLTLFAGFDSSGSRSGEILELSAKAACATSSIRPKKADRPNLLAGLQKRASMCLILEVSVRSLLGNSAARMNRKERLDNAGVCFAFPEAREMVSPLWE